jgi:hypothetical protein
LRRIDIDTDSLARGLLRPESRDILQSFDEPTLDLFLKFVLSPAKEDWAELGPFSEFAPAGGADDDGVVWRVFWNDERAGKALRAFWNNLRRPQVLPVHVSP